MPTNPSSAHRVIAIRAGGDRLLISDQIAIDQAHELRDRLLAADAFPEVIVELDEQLLADEAGKSTHAGESLPTISL